MRTLLCFISLAVCYYSSAQKTVDVNAAETNGIGSTSFYAVNGVPFVNTKFVNLVEGSPYLTTYWVKGRVIGSKGERYSPALLKLDLLSNELHFMSKEGVELVTSLAVREIFLEDTVQNSSCHLINASFLPVPKNEKNGWYQLLDSGQVNLYKVHSKLLSETLPYGASTHEQRITTRDKYYLEINKALLGVRNIKELPELLSERKDDLTLYLKNGDDKNLPVENRWKNAIHYYNSIVSKK